MNKIYHRSWIGTLWLLLVAITAKAEDARLTQVAHDLQVVHERLERLSASVIPAPSPSDTKPNIATQLDSAEVNFNLGDYVHVCSLLQEAMSRSDFVKNPRYLRTTYMYAESLFQIGNMHLAMTHFRTLLNSNVAELQNIAVERLIAIGVQTTGSKRLEQDIATLEKRRGLPAEGAYEYAKSLIVQNNPSRAERILRTIPAAHPIYPKALYLLGASLAMQNRLDTARDIFEQIVRLTKNKPDSVTHFARIAQARILSDQGKLTEANKIYEELRNIPDQISSALYEFAWNNLRIASQIQDEEARQEKLREALSPLELLSQATSELSIDANAYLLMGNLYLQLERYDAAKLTFDAVIKNTAPTRDAILELKKSRLDPFDYLEEFNSKSRRSHEYLPPLAKAYARNGPGIAQAVELLQSLNQAERWLAQSRNYVDRFDAIAHAEQRGQYFPKLQNLYFQQVEIENALIKIEHKIHNLEVERVERNLDVQKLRALEAMRLEREALREDYQALPDTKSDYDKLMFEQRQRLFELRKDNDEFSWEITEQHRIIEALRQKLIEQENSSTASTPNNIPPLTSKERQHLLEELEKQRLALEHIRVDQEDLDVELNEGRTMVAIVEESALRDQGIRARYEDILHREQLLIEELIQQRAKNDTEFFAKTNADRAQIENIREGLGNFKLRLNAAADAYLATVRGDILKQKELIDSYGKTIVDLREDVRRVAESIMQASIDATYNHFNHLVLRGDLGSVDVAWQIKEATTNDINRLLAEQKTQLEDLEIEFKEASGGDE